MYPAALDAIDPDVELALAVADDAVAGTAPADAAERFDVDVHELARPRALITIRGLGRLEPRALAEPEQLQPTQTPSTAPARAAQRSRRPSCATA